MHMKLSAFSPLLFLICGKTSKFLQASEIKPQFSPQDSLARSLGTKHDHDAYFASE